MAAYRYLVADLLTDTLKEEMPFEDVQYGDVLNAPGSFSGKLPLSVMNANGFEKVTRANLDPGRTALYVERDGVLVWGGIIWTAQADDSSFTLTIGAEGFWSYFRRRMLRTSKVYTNADMLSIPRDLVNYAQSVTGGNIGVTVGSETTGGMMTHTITYNAWDRKNIGQAIEELASMDAGFDFAIDVAYASGVRTKTLTFGYPKRGTRLGYVLDLGSNIEGLSFSIDATKMANLVESLGSGDGPQMLIGFAADTSLLATYPLLEDTVSDKDVTSVVMLQNHAKSALTAQRKPVEMLPTLVAHETDALQPGSFRTGDEIEVRTQNAGGFLTVDSIFRVGAWNVNVDNNGKETTAFSFLSSEAFS